MNNDELPLDNLNGSGLFRSRRDWLQRMGCGFGLVGLTGLLAEEGLVSRAAADESNLTSVDPLAPRQPHFTPRAKRVIWIFVNGGPSQVDTWDYKPQLERAHGKSIKEFDASFSNTTGFFKYLFH